MARILVALLGLAAYGAVSPVLAQRRELTLLGGGTLSGVTGTNLARSQARPGFVAGFALRLPRTPQLAVETDVLVTQHRVFGQRPASNQPPVQAGILADAASLLFLEVPILLRLQRAYQQTRPVRPFMLLGPYAGVRLDCRREVTEPNGQKRATDCTVAPESFDPQSPLPAVYQEVDVGLLAGIGVEIRQFALGFRFTRSLRNLVETAGGVHTSPFDGARLWTAMVSVEYVIRVL